MIDPSGGTNQTWDYSSYSPTAIGSGIYTDPTTLPTSSKDKFPKATYVEVWNYPAAPSLDKAIIDYYYDSADSLVRLGQQGSGGNLANTWGDVQGVWNIAYGASKDARNQNMGSKLTMGSFTYAGYGTLKTKYGSYSDVVLITYPGGKNFFQTKPYFGMLMNILYSAPSTIAGAYIYNYTAGTGATEAAIVDEKNFFQTGNTFLFEGSAKLLNLLGEVVATGVNTLDASHLPTGIYFININGNSNEVFVK